MDAVEGQSSTDILADAIDRLDSDPAAAESLIVRELSAKERQADHFAALAEALTRRADPQSALSLLDRLAAAHPQAWAVQAGVARTLLALGQSRAASARLEQALDLNPDWLQGWRLLGDLRRFSRDFKAGRAADDRYLRARAQTPALRACADTMIRGELEAAERELIAALKQAPHDPEIANLLGQVIWRRGRQRDAERLLGALVRSAREDDDFLRLAYADLLFDLGWYDAALEQADAVLARTPDSLWAGVIKCAVLTENSDYAGACDLRTRLLAQVPDQAGAWVGHGYALQTLGRYDDAVAAFQTALALDPARGGAYLGLSSLKVYRFSVEDDARMQAQLKRTDLEAPARAAIQFALGKAREDEQNFEEAFGHYALGNSIVKGLRPHDPLFLRGFIDRCKAVFTPEFFEQRRGWGRPAPDPIFIVGLPRAGSTLIEQILSSHPAIEGTRELEEIQLIAGYLIGLNDERYPQAFAETRPQTFAQLGQDYLKWTQPLRRLGRPRFIDKAPTNFLHVGLIQLILPGAKIIDARRHPLGCCVSAYKEHFASGWEFASDLEDLGRYYAEYVELMDHFDAVLPGKVYRAIYEDLVTDTEAQVRSILDYLELPFDPACLRFFENPRAVATPSAEQVRQPIYDSAKEHWRNFEPWLDPLKQALGPALDAYPAAPSYDRRA